jgi:hypothetical protein
MNVYAAWIATFFSWALLPLIQPINLYRVIRARWLKRSESESESEPERHSKETASGGAPSLGG